MTKRAAEQKPIPAKSISKEMTPVASLAMREVIIQAIADSGKSVRSVALNAGISQPQLSRFVKGERDLLLDAAGMLRNTASTPELKDAQFDTASDEDESLVES